MKATLRATRVANSYNLGSSLVIPVLLHIIIKNIFLHKMTFFFGRRTLMGLSLSLAELKPPPATVL